MTHEARPEGSAARLIDEFRWGQEGFDRTSGVVERAPRVGVCAGRIVGDTQVVRSVDEAAQDAAIGRSLQHGYDLAAVAEAGLADIVSWGEPVIARLRAADKEPGSDLAQDVTLALCLTLLGVSELRRKIGNLRVEGSHAL